MLSQMIARTAVLCLGVTLLLCTPTSVRAQGGPPGGPPGGGGPPGRVTVNVDCFNAESINDAIDAASDVRDLLVVIDGMCTEDVVLTRSRITLAGANGDPTMDGIQGATTNRADEPRGAALTIRDAELVFVENLTISGGVLYGVRVVNSRQFINITECIIEGNGAAAVQALDSQVTFIQTTINETDPRVDGIVAFQGSLIFCLDCSIDVPDRALIVGRQSSAFFFTRTAFSSLTGGSRVVDVNRSSEVTLSDTSVTSTTNRESIRATDGSHVSMNGGSLAARGGSTFSELRWYPPVEAAKGSLSWVFRAKQPESVRTGP